MIQIYSKPFLTGLQKSHSSSFSDSFFSFSLLFFSHSPSLPLHCSGGLSPLSRSCPPRPPSHSIIAKSIWSRRWERLSRNGFENGVRHKNTKVEDKELVKYPCVWPPVACRCPQLGQLLTWNTRGAHPLNCSLSFASPQKLLGMLHRLFHHANTAAQLRPETSHSPLMTRRGDGTMCQRRFHLSA